MSGPTLGLLARPGHIQRYVLHRIQLKDVVYSHLLAKVMWYKRVSDELISKAGNIRPISVWGDVFDDQGPASFIPIQRIKARCLLAKETLANTNVIIVAIYQPQL